MLFEVKADLAAVSTAGTRTQWTLLLPQSAHQWLASQLCRVKLPSTSSERGFVIPLFILKGPLTLDPGYSFMSH